MKKLVRMGRNGLMTVPVKIRRELNLEQGDFMSCYVFDGKIILEPIELVVRELGEST